MNEYRGQTSGLPGGVHALRAVPVAIFVLLLAYVLWLGFYTVAAHEQAVVLRFGRYHVTVGPGLHFKIPLVDKAVLVNTAEHSMRLPWGREEQMQAGRRLSMGRQRADDSLILTGDLYAAVVEWNVIWRVAVPEKYLFSIHHSYVRDVITAVARSTMHRIVGDYSADEVLTGKREEIRIAALKQMQASLDEYDCGVDVMDLQMQRVTPPDRVKPAFDEVNASLQHRDRSVNEGNLERNKLIPMAEARRDQLIREAEGYAARRESEAKGEITALLAKYRAYKEAPDVTRQRLYLEAMEQVLGSSGPKTVLDGDLKSLLPLLNLSDSATPATTK